MKSIRAEPTQSSTQTLGTFLRSHRERLSPADLGLASAGRRRTPGLRREEVAQLCGVSTTWYTWLEQGRSIRASASALGRIAEALQLSRAERLYLFEIARCVVPDSSQASELKIPTGLKDLVDQMPVPVYVLDRQWNAVAWNGRAAKLFRPWLVESEDAIFFVLSSESECSYADRGLEEPCKTAGGRVSVGRRTAFDRASGTQADL